MNYKDKISNPIVREIVEWIEVLVIAFVLAMIIKTFVIETTEVSGVSMMNTLHHGEKLLVNRFIYKFKDPERGDIIVFLPENEKDRNYIKRIIALPGETIDIRDGKVYINDKELKEDYIDVSTYKLPENGREFPYTLSEGEYFAMGDNRINSLDSRSANVGNVTKENVRGQAVCRIYPLDRITGFTSPEY